MDLHEGVRGDHLLEVGRVLQSVRLKRVGGGVHNPAPGRTCRGDQGEEAGRLLQSVSLKTAATCRYQNPSDYVLYLWKFINVSKQPLWGLKS